MGDVIVAVTRQDVLTWLEALEQIFRDNRERLTELDSAIGDADHGINMDRGFTAVQAEVAANAPAEIGSILQLVAAALIKTVGGASGPLYGTFFLRAAADCAGRQELVARDVVALFQAGIEGVRQRGKAAAGDKTMLDALLPAAAAMQKQLEAGADLSGILEAGVAAAEAGMLETIPMQARKGRASYLGPRSIGHQDPGATSAYLLLKTAANAWRPMIGIVVVSHSARLAEGVCELAAQVAQGKVRLAAAGGTSDAAHPIGTDAFKVLQAIESVYSDDGVVVFTDLGSAVLSAETAFDMLSGERRMRVRLSAAPVVEGAVAAASLAAAGANLDEVLQGATASQTPQSAAGFEVPHVERLVTVSAPLGLHARPAAQLIRLARHFQARITIENLTRPAGPFDAGSIHGLLSLGARQGHRLAIRAEGPEARTAVSESASFLEALREGAAPAARAATAATPAGGDLCGIPASAGIAIGPLVSLRAPAVPAAAGIAADPELEEQRLLEAIRAAQAETRALHAWTKANAGEAEAGIFDAQLLFLEDSALAGAALRMIVEERALAEHCWHQAAERVAAEMDSLDDPYLRARASDVRDVAARVLRRLSGLTAAAATMREPSVVTAHDLTPSEAGAFDPALVLGVCLETSSASAHSVILVRAMGIPAVVGMGPGIGAIPDGTPVAVDGDRGAVWVAPGAERMAELEDRRTQWLAARSAAQAQRHRPAATRDGVRIHVFANLSHDTEILHALDGGADGVGVLRTEFLFLGRAEAPDENEQAAVYQTIAVALGEKPLVIRTLDVGGDKPLPYVETGQEANPFLGWRGIRLTLDRRDLLRTQLRAILRAAAGHSVEVLFPMISTLAELREAKAVLAAVEAELAREGARFGRVKVGVMIEVPSAVAVAEQLAREAESFSIGTNDLVQYLMAADRTNARVAPIADPFQPAVLRIVQQAVAAARQAGIGVTLCGELAADLLATPLLLGLGLRGFSVSPPLIPPLKRAIAGWSLAEAEAIAGEAMSLETSDAVRSFLRERASAS